MFKRLTAAFCLLVLLSGCASLPKDPKRIESHSIAANANSDLSEIFDPAIAAHPRRSGVVLLHEPEIALRARDEMTTLAEHTLDVQYYIWSDDKVGRILTQRLLDAADRGVRVRILLDDFTLNIDDIYLAAFSDHPNVELRLFNPFAHRTTKALGFITDIQRVNQRMHNKIFVLDNKVAIVGGRNIGDNYFGVKDSYNSRDIDVLTIGPVVDDISKSFDEYWNSDWAYPIKNIYPHEISEENNKLILKELKKQATLDRASLPFDLIRSKKEIVEGIRSNIKQLDWARIDVIFDPTEKLRGDTNTVAAQFETALIGVNQEMLAEIAYFVPGNELVNDFKIANDKGIHIRFLTNSLTSTEVLPAYAGFSSYRKDLLKAGVELYEYRSDAKERFTWPEPSHNALTRLHSKTFVVDRQFSFIGSFNFDPRSVDLNTEIGLLIDSPEFAEKVIAVLDEGVLPGNAWKLELDSKANKIKWHDQEGSTPLKKEPYSSWWQRVKATVLRILPIESQL
ncbi:phospholipase D family protein [Agaribacterium sp. ZY112]|uniref:phospholipase D family protein n=1 Tax=Agaribacterium sp. ZY112 TaxID=3233574 RepID=UPI003526636F